LKFKIDENLPDEFARILRSAGLDAESVAEERLSGSPDETVLDRSRTEQRALITLDLDFSNIYDYPPTGLPGIIVIRSKGQDKVTLISLLQRLIPVLRMRSAKNQLWIVESDRIRFREA
jgi:predicted nuclease of predicted toxin-antitoxin system